MQLGATHFQRDSQNADEVVRAATVLIQKAPANGEIGWTGGMENCSPQAQRRLVHLMAPIKALYYCRDLSRITAILRPHLTQEKARPNHGSGNRAKFAIAGISWSLQGLICSGLDLESAPVRRQGGHLVVMRGQPLRTRRRTLSKSYVAPSAYDGCRYVSVQQMKSICVTGVASPAEDPGAGG